MTAVQQGWTDRQILEAVVVLIGFCMVLAGLVVFAAGMLNHLAYWVESRHEQRLKASEVVDRCNVYTLRPRRARVDEIRNRRGDAA